MKTGRRLSIVCLAAVLVLSALGMPARSWAGIDGVRAVLKAKEIAKRIPALSAVGTVRYRGTDEAGCWLFVVETSPDGLERVYELRGGGDALYRDGVEARVYGIVRNDVETRCGVPILVVRYYRILRPRPAYGVLVMLDRPTYWPTIEQIGPGLGAETDGPIRLKPAVLHGLLGVVNHSRMPMVLDFRTSQRFDFRLLNCEGEVVWQWSDGKAFLMVLGRENVGPRPLYYPVRVQLADENGAPLPAGTYTLEGWTTHVAECDPASGDTGTMERPVDELAGAVRFRIVDRPSITPAEGE